MKNSGSRSGSAGEIGGGLEGESEALQNFYDGIQRNDGR
jgi:hypothetical protein